MLALSRIVCAAAMNKDGLVIPSPRHFDGTFYKLFEKMGMSEKVDYEWVEGFIDQHGNFFDREEAMIIAKRNDQIFRKDIGSPTSLELFSEHLY